MPVTLVDSNVLLDIMTEDQEWRGWSERALAEASQRGRMVINPVVFAEVSGRFSSIDELNAILPTSEFERAPLPYEAAFVAAKAYVIYRRRGGTKLSVLSDFYIGAHAAVTGYELLTRDVAHYRTYFPRLRLVAPD